MIFVNEDRPRFRRVGRHRSSFPTLRCGLSGNKERQTTGGVPEACNVPLPEVYDGERKSEPSAGEEFAEVEGEPTYGLLRNRKITIAEGS